MFGFLKKDKLLEQKKMLFQNWNGSLEMLKVLESQLAPYNGRGQGSTPRQVLIESAKSRVQLVLKMAESIMTEWNKESPLDKRSLSDLWNDNLVLRRIYGVHIAPDNSMRFDEFVNPPYGWEIALRGW